MRSAHGVVVLALLLVVLVPTLAMAGNDPGIRIRMYVEYDEINAGETLRAGAVVSNHGNTDRFVIVDGFLANVEESIGTPPADRWEKFVWLMLAKISGDCEILHVPAGESRTAILDIDVHPRMHGRFDVVGTATTTRGIAEDRVSVISKITAPPSSGGVLVHGRLYEIGPYRLLVTDDGHIYEPKGSAADDMFDLLDDIYPSPDGVSILAGTLPNTLGGFGVEMDVDLFRFDREPGTPMGYRWRTLSRGTTCRPYAGPNEEIIRNGRRLRAVMTRLGAQLTGTRPNFRTEMAAIVTVPGTCNTRIRVGRIYEKNGALQVHYTVCNPGPGCRLVSRVARPYHIVALPKYRGTIRFVRHDISIRCDAYRTGVLEIERSLDLLQAKPAAAMLKAVAEKAPVLEPGK